MFASQSHVAFYLERYHQGDSEGAFFGLLELEREALPDLMAEFREATNPELRAFLVNVIWAQRQPSVIPRLGEALRDGEQPVWRQALDGLVALACPEALEELHSASGREFSKDQDTTEFREWLEEAMEQAEERWAATGR